jgi:hypothetical protein
VFGIKRTCGLAMFHRPKPMAMSSQRLMCRVSVVLSDLVMPRRFAMIQRRPLVMGGR